MADGVAPTEQCDAKPRLYTSVSAHIQNWIPIVAINECLTGLGLLGYFGQASRSRSGRRGADRPVNQLHPDVSLERSEGFLSITFLRERNSLLGKNCLEGKHFPEQKGGLLP
jgi:hypothetical protein